MSIKAPEYSYKYCWQYLPFTHKWSIWSEPYGALDDLQYQTRNCTICNKVQMRIV